METFSRKNKSFNQSARDVIKVSTIHWHISRKRHPPFNKVLGRKFLPLHSDLEEREQLMGRESQCSVNFIHPHRPYHHTASKYRTECFLLSANEITLPQTGIENKELSVQNADHVAFNKFIQRTVQAGVLSRLAHFVTPGAFWRNNQSCCKRTFCRPRAPSESSARWVMHLNQIIVNATPLTPDIMTFWTTIGSQRSDCVRERTISAWWHSWKKEYSFGGKR